MLLKKEKFYSLRFTTIQVYVIEFKAGFTFFPSFVEKTIVEILLLLNVLRWIFCVFRTPGQKKYQSLCSQLTTSFWACFQLQNEYLCSVTAAHLLRLQSYNKNLSPMEQKNIIFPSNTN